MIRHFLKITLRNLGRQKVLSVINVSGLSIGLACFILFLLYAVSEFSYDSFHVNKDDIYRVYRHSLPKGDGAADYDPYVPMPLGPALKQDMPDIKNYVRMQQGWSAGRVKANGRMSMQSISFADPQFFSIFSFPLRSGNPATVLQDQRSIVLTEEIATELFGKKDPVGELIEIELDGKSEAFTIGGIAKNIPHNSSIRFGMLANFSFLLNLNSGQSANNNWNEGAFHTYVQLDEKSKLAQEQNRLISFRRKYYPREEAKSREAGWTGTGPRHFFKLQPLTDVHTNLDLMGSPTVAAVNPQTIWTLIVIAAGVLLIACINFTTLAIGRSAGRAREVGIRKVVGSVRSQLMIQFITESLVLTVISIIIGIFIAQLALPWFNRLAATELTFSFAQFPQMIWLLAALAVTVGILAGCYPALVLSSFHPIEVLKQKIKVGGANIFTRSLVTFQFVLSIGLIACTLVMLHQLHFISNKNPGFNKENVVVINAKNSNSEKIFPLFKQEASKLASIKGIAGSEFGLGEFRGYSRSGFIHNGQQRDIWTYFIDPGYLQVTGISLIAGRNFDPAIASDTLTSVIVNESLVRNFGWTPETAIGKTIAGYPDREAPVVVGVVKNFHFRPFSETVTPQLFHQFRSHSPDYFFVRLQPGNPNNALQDLEQAWSAAAPGMPFRYSFLDEDLERFYESHIRWSRIIGWAGGISILLAALGLFGLAALSVINRTKEIGIRKILGASMPVIFGLITKDFLKLILIALLIATPAAWYFMHEWLQNFAYRVSVGWWIFLVAGSVSVVIALITIGFHAVKAGLTNPVKSLRTE
jgi:putative ABC transport system permease protein